MKPPPRTRIKPDRSLKDEPRQQRSGKLPCKWQRAELRKLHDALKRLSKDRGGRGDIDYDYLRKHVPKRSVSEIQSVVESLKNKVVSCATLELQRNKRDENKVRKPIEEWTHLASSLAGSLEEAISSAFCQMLVVSSTEPCTLKNCDPPQIHRPPTEDRPAGRTVPLRPMPREPVKQGEPLDKNTVSPCLQGRTPSPKTARELPATIQAVALPNSNVCPPKETPSPTAETSAPSTSHQPDSHSASTNQEQVTHRPISEAALTPQGVCSPVAQTTQASSELRPTSIPTESSSESTSSTPGRSSVGPESQLSTPAAAYHANFGRTSKYATKDCPRMLGVKCVVDFERIYRFLSTLQKPDEDCHLTPMESAIVLDLLMSLPEELRLLDCKELRNHLIKVHKYLQAPADSDTPENMKRGLSAQTEGLGVQDPNRASGPENASGSCDGTVTMDGKREKSILNKNQEQSSSRSDAFNPTGDTNAMGRCPQLNPFMVPLKLLARK